ncbi:MAG: AraC family transcriptional regulator [Sporolactobacillus sp.]|nr:AraC family transcriptional regulator [Sporolactobacillus sp.]
MSYLIINTPSYPFFLYSGDALFRKGDSHRQRTALHMFDLLFVEYGCLYMVDAETRYAVKANHYLILDPDRMHRSFKPCVEETYFHWLHFLTKEKYRFCSNENIKNIFQNDQSNQFDIPKYVGINQSDRLVISKYKGVKSAVARNIIDIMRELESFSINRYHRSALMNKPKIISTKLQQQEKFFNLLSLLNFGQKTDQRSMETDIIMNFLKENYQNPLTLNDLAKLVNWHPTYLIRCFKEKFGTTPVKALNVIRVEHAKNLLMNTALTCEMIANQTGFSSCSYFSKMFKKQVGIPPTAYRSKLAQK